MHTAHRQGGGKLARLRPLGLFAAAGGLLLALLSAGRGQQIVREGFEARDPVWVKGTGDAVFRETEHRLTDETAHGGQRSEFVQLEAEQGTFIHYYFDVGRAPVADELSISVWVKANRPGVQLAARVVLPRDHGAGGPGEPLTVLIRGEVYQQAGRWQRLDLPRPVKQVREQQQVLRAELQRDVTIEGAYVDRVVLNLYGGPGLTRVWIDDLECGPVIDAPQPKTTGRTGAGTDQPGAGRRAALVELKRDRLLVDGKRFFFRGIRHSDTPLEALRLAGFNTLWFDDDVAPERVSEAARLGFLLVPTLSPGAPARGTAATPVGRGGVAAEPVARRVSRFPEPDSVLFWDLGRGLQAEDLSLVSKTSEAVRAADPQRPLALDVWDGFQPYSRAVDLLGVHRWPLMTSLELAQYRDWLNQRRSLAQPGTFIWTWVQTHLPDWYSELVYERPPAGGFGEPVGPQAEQVRLLTYLALASGCRGLGFWSDRFLADSHQGRDRLLGLALLNQELQTLEPLLTAAEAPVWIDTSNKSVKAAVLRTEKGILVLPMWVGAGSQYVPGQAAAANLSVVVPGVPQTMLAWEVSPAEVRSLKTERVNTGGVKVTLPEFGLTSAVVFTGDFGPTGWVVHFQNEVRRTRKLAAQYAHDLARVELDKVAKVHGELEQLGRRVPDGAGRLDDARKRLARSASLWNGGDYGEAYAEANRALRPLRILMRQHWEQATKPDLIDTPSASPYATSFFTLPRHWRFMDQVTRAAPTVNGLPGGDFEAPPEQAAENWMLQEAALDDVTLVARRVADGPKEGRQCLMLQIRPKDEQRPPAALERTFLALHTPEVRMQPGALVQVSGWVRVPGPVTATADGALFYDTAGGEPLAVRLTAATDWKKFTLYRRVPADGKIHATLALTGLGTVYFDDVRIEPLQPRGGQRVGLPARTVSGPR